MGWSVLPGRNAAASTTLESWGKNRGKCGKGRGISRLIKQLLIGHHRRGLPGVSCLSPQALFNLLLRWPSSSIIQHFPASLHGANGAGRALVSSPMLNFWRPYCNTACLNLQPYFAFSLTDRFYASGNGNNIHLMMITIISAETASTTNNTRRRVLLEYSQPAVISIMSTPANNIKMSEEKSGKAAIILPLIIFLIPGGDISLPGRSYAERRNKKTTQWLVFQLKASGRNCQHMAIACFQSILCAHSAIKPSTHILFKMASSSWMLIEP